MTTDREPAPLTREEVAAVIEPFFREVLDNLQRIEARLAASAVVETELEVIEGEPFVSVEQFTRLEAKVDAILRHLDGEHGSARAFEPYDPAGGPL